MRILSYLKLLRPTHWLKNLILFFPPFWGGSMFLPTIWGQAWLPFLTFCFASSATYIFNDIRDSESDKQHPAKRLRPIPSGDVAKPTAFFFTVVLVTLSILIAFNISISFLVYTTAYILISILYSIGLKSYPIIDLYCISIGFILRLLAGGEFFHIPISEWLFLCVFLLSIFLSAGKRLSERELLGGAAEGHRKALKGYPQGFLDGVMLISGSSVLVTYTIYVVSSKKIMLLYTVPLCCFGLLRYLLRTLSGKSGDPTEALTKDFPLLMIGVLWALMVGWGIYVK